MRPHELCRCGAALVRDSVTPDMVGWIAKCVAGHRVFLADLDSPGVILDDVEAGGRL